MRVLRNGRAALAALIICVGTTLTAENAVYGRVELTGLARESWPYNQSTPEQYVMVCNVNGPDGFLTIRTGPDTSFPKARALKRLATVVVDISRRQGHWVRVVEAFRGVTEDGVFQDLKLLPVQGWAHDGYLCDFIE